eukprot:9472812-Pyramimonas_sp.AAC.1
MITLSCDVSVFKCVAFPYSNPGVSVLAFAVGAFRYSKVCDLMCPAAFRCSNLLFASFRN